MTYMSTAQGGQRATEEHGHDHAHPPHLAHHWDTPKQQFEAGKLGMWLFLATEVLLFGGLFVGYSVWRANHPELFQYGSTFLNTTLGATNTVILILSSLTMAMAVTYAQKSQKTGLVLCLLLTLAGAGGFLVIKYFEYTHKFHEGIFPGMKFYDLPGEESHTFARPGEAAHGGAGGGHGEGGAGEAGGTAAGGAGAPAAGAGNVEGIVTLPGVEATQVAPAQLGPEGIASGAKLVQEPFRMEDRHTTAKTHHLQDAHRPANAHMFFNIYFMMTGLHGIHVVVGMIVITWLLVRSLRGDFSAEYFTPVDLGGLYWHIVDLIWIFLFPLFYLI